ncbi:MAG: cobalamin-dependent protein, partial [Nitrospinae bacterium]|nr:cobalamin-dependent protein [Nitrospinota bacterium]
RLKVAEKIIRRMEAIGVPRDRIVFDVLALVVSAMQEGARQTLETIRLVKKETGCPTVAGVSNVSRGLPERKEINNAFLAMAMGAGLDGAIVNPYDERMTRTVAAASLFAGRDAGCRVYIDLMTAAAREAEAVAAGEKSTAPKSTAEQISAAIVEGDKDSIEGLTNRALAEGADAMDLFVGTMTPAIRKLGDLFAQRKKFIPHLVAAADTMKRGVAVLDPALKASKAGSMSKGKVIFATVKGDIHDIGKNVCVVMLENFGFTVYDLGRNVPAEEILAAAKKQGADIIALSALMTTTMMQMKTVVEMVKREGLSCKVMLGGAVVTPSFADEIGADAYGRDVGEVVPVTERLMEAIRA